MLLVGVEAVLDAPEDTACTPVPDAEMVVEAVVDADLQIRYLDCCKAHQPRELTRVEQQTCPKL